MTLAATVGAKNASKSLFYIGTDHALHGINTSDSWGTVKTISMQNPGALTLADQPNAMFAATSLAGATSFYYICSDSLVKATLVNGAWQNPVYIFGNSTGEVSDSTDQSVRKLRIGAGVGLGIGLPLAIGVGVLGYVLLKRRRNPGVADNVEKVSPIMINTAPRPHTPGPPVPQKSPFEMNGWEVVYHELSEDVSSQLSGQKPSCDAQNKKSDMDWV